jgi:hypothetical protein
MYLVMAGFDNPVPFFNALCNLLAERNFLLNRVGVGILR